MSNKKPIFWLVTLNLIFFAGFGGRYLHQRSQINNAEEQSVTSLGQEYEKSEIVSKEDYRKIVDLSDSIKEHHSISDTDLTWWIDLANRSELPKSGNDIGGRRRLVALDVDFRYLTSATSQQRDRIFELAKKYLPILGQSTGKDLYFGVSLICDMKEKRGASFLAQLLNRPRDSEVRQMSEEMLNEWNLQPRR